MEKRALFGLGILSLLLLIGVSLFAQGESEITPVRKEFADGVKVIYDEGQAQVIIKSLVIQGEEFIYLKEVVKLFKLDMKWDALTKKVTLTSGPDTVIFFVGSPEVMVNDRIKRITQFPCFSNGAILLPLEFLSEILDGVLRAKISWEPKTRILRISGGKLNILGIRYSSGLDFARVVIDTRKPLNYQAKEEIPGQVTLVIYGGECNPGELSQEVKNEWVRDIEAFQLPDTTQIVIKLTREFSCQPFTLKNPNRIVLDIKPSARKIDYRINTIVIDPGHGGKDPGAIGRGGTKEKDINLAIAKELERLISERLGTRVILTRTGDYFIPLKERTARANSEDADLFISLHANAALGRSRQGGFETYFHSLPSTEEEKMVARFENSVIKLEKRSRKSLDETDFILWDMAHSVFMKQSSELATLVQEEMAKKLKIANRGVKQANFYVLSGANMPSILIETAFISNPREENKLRNPSFQKRVAKGIYNAIARYKRNFERSMKPLSREQ